LPSHTPRRESEPTQVSARAETTAAAAAAAAARVAATSPLACRPQIHPMATAAEGDPPPSPPLGPVLGTLPAHLFQQEVMRRLGPTALASLAGAGRGCAAVVAVTALMQWTKHAKMTARGHLDHYLPPLCLREACSLAAYVGNREVLEWLHNTGCPWNEVTCWVAAQGGHLAALRWAREHGCPWDSRTLCARRSVRAPARAAVGAGAPLPVGLDDAGIRR
jgi:hypothetical protein